jgi:hypothetical protein
MLWIACYASAQCYIKCSEWTRSLLHKTRAANALQWINCWAFTSRVFCCSEHIHLDADACKRDRKSGSIVLRTVRDVIFSLRLRAAIFFPSIKILTGKKYIMARAQKKFNHIQINYLLCIIIHKSCTEIEKGQKECSKKNQNGIFP